MKKTRIIKLSEYEYSLLKKARQELLYHGIKSLPIELQQKVNLLLKNTLKGSHAKLTLGKMVGLVALALDYSLNRC